MLLGFAMLAISIVMASAMISRKEVQVEAREVPTQVVAEFDTIRLPVPAEVVATGTKLKNVRFTYVEYPSHQLPAGALTDISLFMEATATSPLPAKLPLFQENLSFTPKSINPVIERIPAGMRAMTIRVDATSAVEGWAGSGTMVDVLLIQKENISVIAENVKILSAERSVTPVEGGAAPSVPQTVTLLVSQEQCLSINMAIPLGKIAFALRGASDSQDWSQRDFRADQLRKSLPSRKSSITGYAAVSGGGKDLKYAFVDGQWVKSDVVPESFNQNVKSTQSFSKVTKETNFEPVAQLAPSDSQDNSLDSSTDDSEVEPDDPDPHGANEEIEEEDL